MDRLLTFSTWTPSRTGGSLHTERQMIAINFLFRACREVKLPSTVGAVVPVEGSDNLIVLVGRKVCLVNRDTG